MTPERTPPPAPGSRTLTPAAGGGRQGDSSRAPLYLGWLVVKFVIPMATGALLIVLLTLYLSLRS